MLSDSVLERSNNPYIRNVFKKFKSISYSKRILEEQNFLPKHTFFILETDLKMVKETNKGVVESILVKVTKHTKKL